MAHAVAATAKAGYALIARGGGMSYTAGYAPVREDTIVLDVAGLNRIVEINEDDMYITVEAGVTWNQIYDALRPKGLRLPFFGTFSGIRATVGGGLSKGALFMGTARYGQAADIVLGLEVVLADGRIWNGMRGLRKDNTGYDLKQLFLGSEGTLGIITAAVLKLSPVPRQTVTTWIGVTGGQAAVTLLNRAQTATGGQVTGFEYMVRAIQELTFANLPRNRDPLSRPYPAAVLMEANSGEEGDGLRGTIENVLAGAIEDGLVLDAVIAESQGQAR